MLAHSARSSSRLLLRTALVTPHSRTQSLIRPTNSKLNFTRNFAASMVTQGTTLKLNTGATVPAIGFGTWQDVDDQEQAVLDAIKVLIFV